MKYLFILGRNPELSIQELKSYFEKEDNKIINYLQSKNAVLIDLEKPIKKDAINEIGGTISIGEITSYGKLNETIKELENKAIYEGTRNNFNYCIWDFAEEHSINKISEYLKKRFKSEKLKATEKRFNGKIILQDGKPAPNIISKLINEQYFLFSENKINYFGKIIYFCNYEEIENRDMNKPVRRESLSISPRLAKIMINLSKVKKGETLIDPFCGIGVILTESLIQGIKATGIDFDKEAISDAKKNLEWNKFSSKNYKLINNDSSKINVFGEGIATEPDFGATLKKIVDEKKAKEMQNKFENLMIKVLNNLKQNITKKIVFTAPLIKTNKKRISCNINKILEKTNLKLIEGFPIEEYRKNQIVGRQIIVLEK